MENTSIQNNSQKAPELTFKELVKNFISLLRYLRAKWKTIVIYVIAGLAIGILVSLLKKPVYTAQMTFTVEGADETDAGLSGLAQEFGFDMGGGRGSLFEGDNIIIFFQSRAMVQKTLLSEANFNGHKQVLVNRYIDFNKYRDKWHSKPDLAHIVFSAKTDSLSRLQDSVLGVFYKDIIKNSLSISKIDKKLSVISLTYSCKDELFAKVFAETLTANVIDFYIKSRTKKSQNNVDILQHQTDSVRQVLIGSLEGVATSNDASPNANPLMQVLHVPAQKKAVDVEVSKAVLTELVKNLELSKIALRKETPLIEIIDEPILPLKVDKVSKIKGMAIGAIVGFIIGVLLMTLKKLFQYLLS